MVETTCLLIGISPAPGADSLGFPPVDHRGETMGISNLRVSRFNASMIRLRICGSAVHQMRMMTGNVVNNSPCTFNATAEMGADDVISIEP